ncbi:hypothetical protein AMTRI_Chr01g102670 [Amborella trichopoda]|uniref:uncharacterized protein LOC105421895 n=1 Tax=Amborella trichopoda TaxID=13333 RepID=UPI0005D2F8F7|nr:uncharacterized protein LOC105421895 [Amborella trichopoda]|eukprot:XP_011629267.1 uncharacterized protein LOC105421895 [Amborella trichopoda]
MGFPSRRGLVHLLLIFLFFLHLISSKAVPLSRSISLLEEDQPTVLETAQQVYDGDLFEENTIHGRILIETNDYPGSGANSRHDPKTPGRR